MSLREEIKQRYKRAKGDIKALFKSKDGSDTATTRPNTPSGTPSHTNAPALVGQIGSPGPSTSWTPTPAQAEPVVGYTVPDHTKRNNDPIGEPTPSRAPPMVTDPTPTAWKSLKELARVLGPVTGLFGPMKEMVEVFVGCVDTYKVAGAAKVEYEEIRARLETIIEDLGRYFGQGGSLTMTTSMESVCGSIKAELEKAQNKLGRNAGVRYLEAADEGDVILACYRRIELDLQRLVLNANWETLKDVKEHAASSRIDRLSPSLSAHYNSVEADNELKRQACTPGTRTKVLEDVLDWTRKGDNGTIYWLNGMAGTGKTTIAYSVCDRLNAEHKLAASFFCSRLREECRMVKRIIPSLAYQLARFSLPFLSVLSAILQKDPDVHSRSLQVQFEELIAKPLHAARDTLPEGLVIAIDALDECGNKESPGQILDILLDNATDLPVKFLVSSRPESEIHDRMTDERVKSRLVLHELDKGEVQADIEKYLRAELTKIKPSDEDIAALVSRAGILFIYAATAVRYIGYRNFHHNPRGRLRTILDSSQAKGTSANKEIDQLYATILEASLGDKELDEAERDTMRQVLFTAICAMEPLTVSGLSRLLQINDVDRVRDTLRPLWSVLHVLEANDLVTTLHASFPDFMFDSTRSGEYCCNSVAHNCKLAGWCLVCIKQTQPQFNICGLESSYLPDEKAPNIKERVSEAISSELLYACRYWAGHVEAGQCAPTLTEKLEDFLFTQLLLWMEVLNLNQQMKSGTECMRLMVKWCDQLEVHRELVELARDAERFVEAFASNSVSESTPHIYVSMLAFWPESAPITKHYDSYTRGPVKAEGAALERRRLAHLATWPFEKFIAKIAMSPDGQYVALAISDGMIVVDLSSGRVALGPFNSHKVQGMTVQSIAFSPDGICLFAGYTDDNDATILGWDIHSSTNDTMLGPLQLRGHTGNINCLSFSFDCARIATGSDDKTVRVWRAENGNQLHCLETQDRVWDVKFSPDSTEIAAGFEKALQIWDSETGDTILGPLTTPIPADRVSFSPDKSRIIYSSIESGYKSIYVLDARTGEQTFGPIEGHTDRIWCIGWSPDGRYIVSGSEDRTVCLWDAQNGNLVLGPLEAHTGGINSVAFSPDGSRIISACSGGLVCTWDARQRNLTSSSSNAPFDRITCVKFSSDGTRFVSGSAGGAICIWDGHTGEMKVGPIKAHTRPIIAVDFLNDHVVSGSADGKIWVCDAVTGEAVLGPLEVHPGSEVRAIAYSPDGKHIATGSDDEIDLWDAQTGSRVLSPLTGLEGTAWSIQFSPDGTRIVGSSLTYRKNIVVWDVSDGKSLFGTLDGHRNSVCSVSFSPDGTLIASGSGNATIIIWDASTGRKALGPLTGHSDWVRSVHFSPNSTRLVSGSHDRTIRIWDVRTGETLFEILNGHENFIRSVAYSPDGTRILSCSDDMSVHIHDAQSPEERALSGSECEVGEWTLNKDGWVVDDRSRLLVWVPGDLRKALGRPRTLVIVPHGKIHLKFDKSRLGESWAQSYGSRL
ncbi:unnamed protein product [Rhizoctonia solani]|uniref:Nephrocystin 3-like N-terminal domain-containing protein n=1 Tax=Rhizoctonia solani TaxID=456999 RepID=A0A8H3AA24_9AGAM|nr:unnamed protein product [Rhizoctonia solani]